MSNCRDVRDLTFENLQKIAIFGEKFVMRNKYHMLTNCWYWSVKTLRDYAFNYQMKYDNIQK